MLTDKEIYSSFPLPITGLDVGGKFISVEDAIQKLDNILTDDRKEKINQVVSSRTNNFIPVVENIYDKGNINAVMRSAEAFGFYNMYIVDQKNSIHKPSNRVSQGTHKWLDIQMHSSSLSAVSDLKKKGVKVYCTHLSSSKPLNEIDFTEPTAVVFGNEKDGVSDEMMGLADGNCIIPMEGFAQSFNISVAAAICFYHVYLQRITRLGKNGDLSLELKRWLTANYYIKTFGDMDKFKILCRNY